MQLIVGIHKVSTWLVLAVGVIHTLGTFLIYDGQSEAAIWFAGAGLGGIYAALLNIGLWQRGSPSLSRRLTGVANVLFIAWLVVGFAAAPALPPGMILAIGTTMALCGIALVLSEARTETGADAT